MAVVVNPGLNRSENPKLELTSDLKGAAVTGTSVTLFCTLKPHFAGWKFYWIKPTQSSETETETHHYFISSVRVSDGGQYKCRARRGNTVYYTDYSDALWVNVTVPSLNRHLIVVEEFEYPNEPRSHVVRGLVLLVGSPKANGF
ncbi:hypothetical protein QTP86_001841 [Hemibagrus guttatus]|nr:hypothetical protein QTP86_001841 [Hemibagrus guttatus]